MNIASALRPMLKALCTLGVLLSVACSEAIDTGLQRRSENEKAFNAYASDKGYERVMLRGDFADRYIYMHWEHKASDRTKKPIATDYIRMRYKGYFLTNKSLVFDSQDAENIQTLRQGAVNGYISGVSIALQSMALGDKATVVIPWFLGYGSEPQAQIPSYSGLIFDIELVDISKERN